MKDKSSVMWEMVITSVNLIKLNPEVIFKMEQSSMHNIIGRRLIIKFKFLGETTQAK